MSSLFLGVLMKFSPMQRQTCTHMTLTRIVSIFLQIPFIQNSTRSTDGKKKKKKERQRTSRNEPQLHSAPSHALQFIIHEFVCLCLGYG